MSRTILDQTTFQEAHAIPPESADSRLRDTRLAFDSVADDYDGPIGNNALIQRMREVLWRTVAERLSTGARLLDLGCGTGIDAFYFASHGYEVFATDWSRRMVARTRARAAGAGLNDRITAEAIGLHELDRLAGETFDGIYSDLGALNCVPALETVAQHCAGLLKPNGIFVASTIGRTCPWELIYYLAKTDWGRARLRSRADMVPVNLNHHTVWTRYYSPGEFFGPFAKHFELTSLRGMGLFVPPPYLIRFYERYEKLFVPLVWADEHFGGLPILREAGDHFLIVLTRRD
jgi:SAM-dependent methyltransferase